ncbi:MAG: phosphoenolpyruvate--protein phosphotransferase [Lachnospiraceae bacterium]|nr:phosphoenolpyruvate--protein phosphotransferase [Lachnospiraceae bacterium]
MVVLQGKSVFRDICVGPLFFYRRSQKSVLRRPIVDKKSEIERYRHAREEAAAQLQRLYEETVTTAGSANASIFEIHKMMLDDAEYVNSVENMINAQGMNPEYAVYLTGQNFFRMFVSMEDDYMRQRAEDVKDISSRLIDILTGESLKNDELPREASIIVADDLMPSETVRIPGEKVLGFVMRKGSVNSHTAILARSMGIPALVEVGDGLLEEYDGLNAAVDGYGEKIYINPDGKTLSSIRERKQQSDRHRIALGELKGKDNVTLDGRRIRLFANIGSLEDADKAKANDAGGIGLLRSELLYLGRDSEPDEETQYEFYKAVLEKFEGHDVVIRTLDIGADKQVPYLGLEKEENPAMGLRAVRLCLRRPELLKTQLRALYRAGVYGRLNIMYPMITSESELIGLKEIQREVISGLESEGADFARQVPVGIMIETPAAAIISDRLAAHVDFFSVGTNDLTQYTLAMDRQNRELSGFMDTHHEAVLRLIETAARNAHRAGIWIGICGELAADETLTGSFISMGIDELSVAPSMILPIRRRIRELNLEKQDGK